jgi:predicted PurR-regulated permease PerM
MLRNRRPAESTEERSTLASIGTLVATLVVLYLAREIFIPFAFALALSFILTPLALRLQRIRLGRVPSVMIVMFAVVAFTAAVSWMVGNQLIEVADHLPARTR